MSDHNLCPRMLWTPVFPRKILQDPPAQCRPDLLDPKGSLSLSPAFSVCLILSFFFSLFHSLTHTHTPTTLILKGQREKKREMAPVIFPLLTGAVQRSLSQSPRGEDIKQRKNLSHFIVFYHRELISIFSLSHSVFPLLFFFFLLLTHSLHSSSSPFSSASVDYISSYIYIL